MLPVIVINGEYIGGYTQLVEGYDHGKLEREYAMWNHHETECYNDDSVTDAVGATCSTYYNGDNIEECGDYDTESFVAHELCCNCK